MRKRKRMLKMLLMMRQYYKYVGFFNGRSIYNDKILIDHSFTHSKRQILTGKDSVIWSWKRH